MKFLKNSGNEKVAWWVRVRGWINLGGVPAVGLLLLLPMPFANACGVYYYGEDYRVALLNPYIIGSDYATFFYSADYLNGYENNRRGSDRRRNCEEWADYLGNGVTASDVNVFLYATTLDDVLNAIAEGADNQQFGENLFFKTLLKPEKKSILDYLIFAKKYEHYSLQHTLDPWAENHWNDDSQSMEAGKQQLKSQVLALLPSLKDPWLRRRYAYQLLLMHRYAGERAAFDKIYSEYFKNDRSTVLSDWALHHRAAMMNDPAQRSYLYALSFDRCPEKDVASYQNFDRKLLSRVLGFAQNDRERAVILALFEIKNPGRSLANIEKIYSLDPANRFLPLLLVREINKLEDWLLTDELTGMGTAKYPGDDDETKWEWSGDQWEKYRQLNRQKDLAYLGEVQRFIQKMLAGKPGSASADLLNLLAGHLFLMGKNSDQAAKYLATISKNGDSKIREQQVTEQLLLLLNREDIGQPEVQQKMVALLRFIGERLVGGGGSSSGSSLNFVGEDKGGDSNGRRDFEALNRLVSREFLKKGNLPVAYFLGLHALNLPSAENWDFGTSYYRLIQFLDWRAGEQDIDAVLALLEKKDKTDFEKYLTGGYAPSRNALLDLRGTISFRKNDLKAALTAFSKVEQEFWKTKYEFRNCLVSDPFVIWQDSTHRGQFPATKTAFVQRLLDLEEQAKNNPAKAAESYLLLGTAWLNCSYHGKSWMMFSYGKSINEQPEDWGYHPYQPRSPEMENIYYGCSRALDYLERAKAAGQGNDRVLAMADFLKARIEWHRYNPEAEDAAAWEALDWQTQGKFLREKEMSFYKNWVTAYKGSATWQEVTGVCPELGAYFGK